MQYPSLFDRVRINGRDGQFVVIRVDHFASIVDLCPPPGCKQLEKNIPFNQISASTQPRLSQSNPMIAESLISARETLYSSFVQLASSHHVLADLRDLVRSTETCIRATQQRIADSDSLIARSRFSAAPEPESAA